MRRSTFLAAGVLGLILTVTRAEVVFDATSPYHHIRVIDERGLRTLSFDGTMESRMSLADPAQGHFQYTEFFQMPWLWNQHLSNVLMVGLGGASTQRAYQRSFPQTVVETAEIDPVVLKVAVEYFHFQQSLTNHVTISDGRVFLRRSTRTYDALVMDAYVKSRYGSFIPYHLTTQEFFKLAHEHLTTNGVIAYNVIGSLQGWRADILGAIYRTMKSVFPQVYLFPATDSLNVVLMATESKEKLTPAMAVDKASELQHAGLITMPSYLARVRAIRTEPPPSFLNSPILTDDFAPIDGLLRGRN
jgi:spermidine synthase